MALILKKIWHGYLFLFDDIVDQRTKSWPFVAKPYQTLAILALYLTFVLKWGPKFMHKRQPYDLKKILIVYNIAQVLACFYIFYEAIVLAWGWRYKWLCEPLDTSYSDHALAITRCCYCYFLTKLVDLLDTVFFVLRKKQNQVSFLHLYHHTGMVLLIWGAVTYFPGGHGTFIGVINCFVHMVMYSYYLITVIYPEAKNIIWLKKHITQLQIIQFLWCIIHMAAIVFIPDCEFPRWISAVFLPQNIFMLVLFLDFYIKTYIKAPKKAIAANKTTDTDMKNQKNGFNGTHRAKNESYEATNGYKNGLNSERSYSDKNEDGVSLNTSYNNVEREKVKDT